MSCPRRAPGSLVSAGPGVWRQSGARAYTEGDGRRAQIDFAKVEKQVAMIRKATQEAGASVSTANSELAVRPGMERVEKIWQRLVLAIGVVLGGSVMVSTMWNVAHEKPLPADGDDRE